MSPSFERMERLMLAAGLAVCAALALLHGRSTIAKDLAAGRVISGWLELRAPQMPSGKYLLFYSPARSTLDLVFVPPNAPPSTYQQAAAAIGSGYAASWGAPAGLAPSDPGRVKAWVAGWPKDHRFWLSFFRGAHRIAEDADLTRYDALLLALELFRTDLRHVRLSWLPPEPALAQFLDWRLEKAVAPPVPHPLTVEVLNGSGETGLALQATKILRAAGLDVVEFGNSKEIAARSTFIDHIGIQDHTFQVADILGCRHPDVSTRLDLLGPAAVSVTLGADFADCRQLRAQSHSERKK